MGQAASPSLYDFAGGDPVNFFDPTGRCPDNNIQTPTNLTPQQLTDSIANYKFIPTDPTIGGHNPSDPNVDPNWTEEDKVRAKFADLVYYTDSGGLLKKLGIPYDPTDGFAAALYKGSNGTYYLAFRGTELTNLADWEADGSQALSLSTSQYNQAINLAKLVSDAIDSQGGTVVFVGHSLGGGLASAAAYATGGDATTFNAAGLSYEYQQGTPGTIRAHYIVGDIVSMSQDLSTLPSAAGQRIPHDVPNNTPSPFDVPISPIWEAVSRHYIENFHTL
jgi:pimeloyl-ACP methyl ester carboxylesterase